MKNMKSRITAMMFAAAMTVCASQAITASAEQFYYDTQSQDWCELPQNMGYTVRGWSRFMGYNAGSKWINKNGTPKSWVSGTVCGEGYENYAHTSLGQTLTGSVGFCRELADTFFGTKTYMEIEVWGDTPIKPGDQIKLGLGTANTRTIFVAYVNGLTFETYSLDSNNTILRETFRRASSNSYMLQKLNDSGAVVSTFTMDYLNRPIKQGDANGDGVFDDADKEWIEDNIGNQPGQYPKNVNTLMDSGTHRADIFARALWADPQTWCINYSTYYTVGWNLYHKNGQTGVHNDTGRMTWDGSSYFYYVKMDENG